MLLALLPIAQMQPAIAVEPDEILSDPALEARAREVSRELRCVVCQSQSIDDSDAPLAKDLRLLVRERIKSGDSNEEAIAYIAERYGDYVLLKPRMKPETILLWGAPMLAFFAAGGAALWYLRRGRVRKAPAPLSAEEQTALDQLLK